MLVKNKLVKLTSFLLVFCMLCSMTSISVFADGLFDINFFYFHYVDENGKVKEESFYNWGDSDEAKNGIKIEKTSLNTIQVVIDADSNEIYQQCKPVLLWVRKADSMFDATKWTDIDQWYENKLEETYLLCMIEDYTQDCQLDVDVPLNLTFSLGGLLNGGYLEAEFFGEGAIPEQLMFAYEAQTYTLEELEKYIQYEMNERIDEYYDVDSGFKSDVDGFTFRNSDYHGGGGSCAGYSAITTAKYNGYDLLKNYKFDDTKYNITEDYTWYQNIYGDASIRDIVLVNNEFVVVNSPSYNMLEDGTATCYPCMDFDSTSSNDKAFYDLIRYYLMENNKAVLLRGNSSFAGKVILSNLENRWSIIDYVASYLRQGKAVTVNISKVDGGHAIVGYKMEKIDDDTYRLYCYDCNWPDDMAMYYKTDAEKNYDVSPDGSFENIVWAKRECYIDFTKKTIVGKGSGLSQREYDVFEFDSSMTSFGATSDNAVITFSLCKGDSFGIFNYGNQANEIIAYRAFPVIESDNKVQIRTFAYYKSGEVVEITNSVNTTVKMDMNYLGYYKIKDSTITLTKNGYAFTESNSTQFIECKVVYDNNTDNFGSIKVRIPIGGGN